MLWKSFLQSFWKPLFSTDTSITETSVSAGQDNLLTLVFGFRGHKSAFTFSLCSYQTTELHLKPSNGTNNSPNCAFSGDLFPFTPPLSPLPNISVNSNRKTLTQLLTHQQEEGDVLTRAFRRTMTLQSEHNQPRGAPCVYLSAGSL